MKEKNDKKKKVPSGEAEAEGTRGSARLDGLWPGQAAAGCVASVSTVLGTPGKKEKEFLSTKFHHHTTSSDSAFAPAYRGASAGSGSGSSGVVPLMRWIGFCAEISNSSSSELPNGALATRAVYDGSAHSLCIVFLKRYQQVLKPGANEVSAQRLQNAK